MSPTTHRVLDDLVAARVVWERLERASPTSPFQTYAWNAHWYETIGRSERVQPALVVVECQGVPWMLLPLGIRPGRFGRVLEWLGGELADYLAPLVAPECPEALLTRDFAALWRTVVASLPAFTYAHLERQPERLGERPNPFRQLDWRENPSRAHHTVLQPSWTAYYRAKSSARSRQTDRRKERRLEDHGPLTFEIASGDRAAVILETLYAQKSRSYQELGVEDLFADERYRRFVTGLTAAAPDLAHVSALRIGDRLLATHWGLLHQRRFYCLLPTYEQSELTPHSPGAVLRLRLLQWACEQGVEVFDFTVGDEPYKDRWCEVSTALYDGLLPGSAWGHVCTAGLHAGTALTRRLTGSPTVFPLLVRLRALWGGRGRG